MSAAAAPLQPVVDAHHHIWRRADLPWLTGPMQPRIFGPYEPIRRDYPMREFLADVEGSGVVASVYVQVNWAPGRFEDEVAWVSDVAAETGWPHAIVGYADVTADDVTTQLERLAAYPLVRGIRQQFHWHDNALYRFAARPDLLAEPAVRRNIAKLADHGWAFDLQVFANQMTEAAGLVRACPDVPFVLQHCGMPEDLSADGREAWLDGLKQLADISNCVVKLSGLGTFIHRNDPGHIAGIASQTVALFGPDRCLFGSNFPIEKLWTDYRSLIGAYRAAIAPMGPTAEAAVFHDTAKRVYRIT